MFISDSQLAAAARMRREFMAQYEPGALEFAERYVGECGSAALAMRALASCFVMFGVMLFWKCGVTRAEMTRALLTTMDNLYSAMDRAKEAN